MGNEGVATRLSHSDWPLGSGERWFDVVRDGNELRDAGNTVTTGGVTAMVEAGVEVSTCEDESWLTVAAELTESGN